MQFSVSSHHSLWPAFYNERPLMLRWLQQNVIDSTGGVLWVIPLDEEVVGQWLDSLDLSSSTKNTYKRAFKSFCGFVKDTSLDFDTLTKRDIISFREYLSVDKRLKPTTVSNYLGAVRSFFS